MTSRRSGEMRRTYRHTESSGGMFETRPSRQVMGLVSRRPSSRCELGGGHLVCGPLQAAEGAYMAAPSSVAAAVDSGSGTDVPSL